MSGIQGGALVVVGTPIGNLGDLSPRGRDALGSADVIACEDTRRTGRLLHLAGIPKRPLMVTNEHTEHGRSDEICDRIRAGERVALVSDAGMPGVSDPGQRVVAAVVNAGLSVEVVPGPTAAISALVLSGLVNDRFVFEGFLARKGGDRARQLSEIAAQTRTSVIYESPKRVVKTLGDLATACGPGRQVAVARELTKLHETVLRGGLVEVSELLAAGSPRGEFVIVLAGKTDEPIERSDAELREMVDAEVAAGASRRDAAQAIADRTGLPKRRIYDITHG